MNSHWNKLKPARTALILLALSALVAVSVTFGLAGYVDTKEQQIVQTEQQTSQLHTAIHALEHDLNSIDQFSAKYQQLDQLGFNGKPDRDGWVHQLLTIHQETRLPPTLRYTLAPPLLLEPSTHPDDTQLAYRNRILHHDLSIELSEIHEDELLYFFELLGNNLQAPFRVEACQIARENQLAQKNTKSGAQIQCVLQIFSLPTQDEPAK